MKQIVLQQMTLLNFKGIRELTIDFDDRETNIRGANAAGKTTVFDAFTWVLFGKDSSDRKDFNIKTLDEYGEVIPRLPHEVSITLTVGGEEVTLKKCYVEKWTKKRGSAMETFTGNGVECYWNDVPCTATEYAKKVAGICDEQVFKLITNPLYFTSQKKDYQRQLLFRLAGDITLEDIAEARPEFADLVRTLSGKTLEEYKREVQSKKRKIKDTIENIPARIDERKRSMPKAFPVANIKAEIERHLSTIADINAMVADRSKAYNEATRRKQAVAKELSEVKGRLTARRYEVRDSMLEEYRKQQHDKSLLEGQYNTLSQDKQYKRLRLPQMKQELADLQANREVLLQEWKAIKADTLTFNEDEFVCPMCHRPLEADDIEAKKEELTQAFNAKKARRLDENKSTGVYTKNAIEAKQKAIDALEQEIFDITAQLAAIEADPRFSSCPAKPDTEAAVNADKMVVELTNKANDLQNQLAEEAVAPDTADLVQGRLNEEDAIEQCRRRLQEQEQRTASEERIAELEKEYSESQAVLAQLEGEEYNIQQFAKARVEQVEGRINGLFYMVSFKMYEQQINGGEIETCEAMVDGVPYSDLNNAMKINAGLDIIRAICNHFDICAPVVLDNRESVSEIISMDSQIVNLIVDADCHELEISL